MRTKLYIIALMSIISSATFAVDFAPNQEWQSTSVMQTSGSTYSPQVTEVGSSTIASVATTTETYSPNKAPGGPRRIESQSGRDPGDATTGSDLSPLGDGLLPLLMMAATFCGVIAFRRRRTAKATK